MLRPLTFEHALAVWGIERASRRGAGTGSLLQQTPDSIKKRYRILALEWHPDKRLLEAGGGGCSSSAAEGDEQGNRSRDLDWLGKARDLLLEKLEAEKELDRQWLAKEQRRLRDVHLNAASSLLQRLADHRHEFGQLWRVPPATLQLRFSRKEWCVGQRVYRYLGVTLSGGGRSTTAFVTKHGFLLQEPFGEADHLFPGLTFAQELLCLQQACDARGWSLEQLGGGALSVQVSGHHSAAVSAQQLVDGTATVALLQAAENAEPDLQACAAAAHTPHTAGTAGGAPAPATAVGHERGLGSAAAQPSPAPGASHLERRPTLAQRMMRAAAAPVADEEAPERQLIKEVTVGSSFLSHKNFSLNKQDVARLLGEDWDGQPATCSAEDMQGRPFELRIKAYHGQDQQKCPIIRHRMCFSRALLQANQVRQGQGMQIWRTAGGDLQVQFVDLAPAAAPSGSGSGNVAASKQHSTGSKRGRHE